MSKELTKPSQLIRDREALKKTAGRISLYGHELDPIKIALRTQPDIIADAKRLEIEYGDICNVNTIAAVEFTDRALQYLAEASLLPNDQQSSTIRFLQKMIHRLTIASSNDNSGASEKLRGLIREANFLNLLYPAFNLYRSMHLDLKHKIDFVVANGTHCLPINVKGYGKTNHELLSEDPPVWIVRMSDKIAHTSIHGILYKFPLSSAERTNESDKVFYQIQEGMQLTAVVVNLRQPPSDPYLSSHTEPYPQHHLLEAEG